MKNINSLKVVRALHIAEDAIIIISLVVVLLMTIINVVLRFVFLTGLLWSEEFIGFNMLIIGMFGIATCVRDKLNTSLDSVVSKFPLKLQNVFYFVVNILVLALLAYFTYGGFVFLGTVEGQMSAILNWPMKVFYALIPIGFVLCIVEQVICMVHDIANKECRFKTIEEQIAEDGMEGETL